MPIKTVEFTDFEKQVAKTHKPALQLLAPGMGKAYVLAICRDNCPACKRQTPKLDKTAEEMTREHGNKLVFVRIHVKQPRGDNTESVRAKDIFRHYFYPTNMILFRTQDRGTIEYYRNSSPRITELKRNIKIALETAKMLSREKS